MAFNPSAHSRPTLDEGRHVVSATAHIDGIVYQNGIEKLPITFATATGASFTDKFDLDGEFAWRLSNLLTRCCDADPNESYEHGEIASLIEDAPPFAITIEPSKNPKFMRIARIEKATPAEAVAYGAAVAKRAGKSAAPKGEAFSDDEIPF